MLLAIDPDEDFIDVESVTVATVLSLQSAGINSTELDAPEANRFSGYSDASFGEKILNISMTEIEAIVEPDGVGDDIGWKPMTLICIHAEIVSQTKLIWQYLHLAWFLPVSVN